MMTSRRLFVGGLPYSMDDRGLKDLFNPMGKVVYARVILHPKTGLSRGFGFVEMATAAEAERAIQSTLETEIAGRKLVVAEAWESRNGEGQSHE